MAGLGAQAYMSSLELQSNQVSRQEQQLTDLHRNELLAYSSSPSGPTVTNTGGVSAHVVSVILRYPNGTVYGLAQSFQLPSGMTSALAGVVPSGTCGGSTCIAKYNRIASGAAPTGSSVGLVTSLGNTFWYTPSAAAAPWGTVVRVTADQTNGGGTKSATLTFTPAANTNYVFNAYIYATNAGGSGLDFQVKSLLSGETLVAFCADLFTTPTSGSQSNCIAATGVNVFSTYNIGTPTLVMVYGTLSVGANAGAMEIDFQNSAGAGTTTIKAGSFMVVTPVA